MMGHETLQMIYERYYSHIKNYERDEGSAFMERVYKPTFKDENGSDASVMPIDCEKGPQKYPKRKNRELGHIPNSLSSQTKKHIKNGAEAGI